MRKAYLILFLLLSFSLTHAQYVQSDESLAFQYYQTGEFDKAAVLFEKIFTKSGERTAYFEYYFNSLLKIKKTAEAEKLALRMVKKYPSNNPLSIALAKLYLETGRNAMAEKTYEAILNNLDPDENNIRETANSFFRIEAYDQAALTFVKGRKLLNDNSKFTLDLISIYRYKKNKDLLVEEYLNLLIEMPDMLFNAQNALAAIFESNEDYTALQTLLLKKIQKNPDVLIFTEMLTWGYIQKKEYDMALRQLIALDKRVKKYDAQIFNAARAFNTYKAYEVAIKGFEYVTAKGKESEYYLPARLELINTKYLMATASKYSVDQINELSNAYLQLLDEFGRSAKTLFAIKRWANLQAYYLHDYKKAELALEDALKIRELSNQDVGLVKLDLGDIYLLTDQPWESILLYQQVANQYENTPVGNEANFKTAKISFYQGNFEFAKAQADILKASTTQLIANDALNLSLLITDNLSTPTDSLALKMFADAELLQIKNNIQASLEKLDSIKIKYPQNSLADDISLTKSKLYLSLNEIPLAVKELTDLYQNFPESMWADDALFTLADIYEIRLNDSEKAKILFQKLITDYPGSLFIAEARKRFRTLRGDSL